MFPPAPVPRSSVPHRRLVNVPTRLRINLVIIAAAAAAAVTAAAAPAAALLLFGQLRLGGFHLVEVHGQQLLHLGVPPVCVRGCARHLKRAAIVAASALLAELLVFDFVARDGEHGDGAIHLEGRGDLLGAFVSYVVEAEVELLERPVGLEHFGHVLAPVIAEVVLVEVERRHARVRAQPPGERLYALVPAAIATQVNPCQARHRLEGLDKGKEPVSVEAIATEVDIGDRAVVLHRLRQDLAARPLQLPL
eukprot:CAMPEP_0119059464 /NCGR_PEP_ID=MMETSP1178-20130426/3608_1 /TAXON_ID=33656 /ORGANISM="unid sp, Strain CCMP2000" /LENGTH=249 /DNA_ID=CAMNT_0007040499 /DNA_START=176 /DNA_END=925 /DNA_ORIENTATION=+